jgi:hypothetical protein
MCTQIRTREKNVVKISNNQGLTIDCTQMRIRDENWYINFLGFLVGVGWKLVVKLVGGW